VEDAKPKNAASRKKRGGRSKGREMDSTPRERGKSKKAVQKPETSLPGEDPGKGE